MNKEYCSTVRAHYQSVWGKDYAEVLFSRGPIDELPENFRILRFPPTSNKLMWAYATQCMSQPQDENRVELHLFTQREYDDEIAELLTRNAIGA